MKLSDFGLQRCDEIPFCDGVHLARSVRHDEYLMVEFVENIFRLKFGQGCRNADLGAGHFVRWTFEKFLAILGTVPAFTPHADA